MISKKEIICLIQTNARLYVSEKQFKSKFKEHYDKLIKWKFPEDFKWVQKLYHYLYDDFELKLGICPVCGKRCKFLKFNKGGYSETCSYVCGQLNPKTREKIENTSMMKYGVKNGGGSKQALEKSKQTSMEKYNVEFYSQTRECQEKIEQTNLEKYGCKNVFQNEEIKDKIKETNLEKYGCEYPMQSKEIQEKYKETNLKNLGVEYPSQSGEIQEKTKQTNLEKYGCEYPMQSKEIQEKSKQTNLENLGVEYTLQSKEIQEKSKQTNLEKYGCEYSSQSGEIKEKTKQTNLKKYGKEFYTQTHECHKKRRKRISYDNLTFDSSWEVKVYQYCKENNISCIYQPDIQFVYEYQGKEHVYQPDFLINDKLYEVKGDQFFEGDKMINPFDRSQDGLFEMKHQCMIENNVVILKKDDINQIKNSINIF